MRSRYLPTRSSPLMMARVVEPMTYASKNTDTMMKMIDHMHSNVSHA